MMITQKILRKIAKVLLPYIQREESKAHSRGLINLSSKMKNCSTSLYMGNCYEVWGEEYIEIGAGFTAAKHFRLEAIDRYGEQKFSPQIRIGNNVSFQDFCHVGAIERIEIGDGCMFASKVFITDHYHGPIDKTELNKAPGLRTLISKPVVVGKNCWIGDGVCILPGVTLGNNVIVGANAVVTHSFPEDSVIAGCPAKIIKMLE